MLAWRTRELWGENPDPRVRLGLFGRWEVGVGRFEREDGREGTVEVVFGDPAAAGLPVGRVRGPAVGALLDPLPIGPAEEGGIEVAAGEPADLPQDGVAAAFSWLELIGEEDDLGDEGHFGCAEGVVADGSERFVIGDAEALAEDDGGDGAVEEDGLGAVGGSDGDAGLGGEAELLGGWMRAEEVVAPGGELDAIGVDIPADGEVARFVDDALDVTAKAGGEVLVFGADAFDLLRQGGHRRRRRRGQPSGPRRRPPRRCMWRWKMVIPAASPTLNARR